MSWLLALVATLPHAQEAPAEESTPAATPHRFLDNGIIAAGGNAADHPTHSRPAIQSALDLEVAWVALQLQQTHDGQLVVLPSATTRTIADRNLNVTEVDLEELLELDIAAGFRKAQHLDEERCPPQKALRLTEVLEMFLAQDRSRVLLGCSSQLDVEVVTAAVDAQGAGKWVGFMGGSLPWLKAARNWRDDVPAFWTRQPNSNVRQDTSLARGAGVVYALRANGYSMKNLKVVQKSGVSYAAWQSSKWQQMESLVGRGVTTQITDHPAHLKKILEQRKKR